VARGTAFDDVRRSEASNRSSFIFSGLGIFFHVLRALKAQRIGFSDYATDELKK
jgi:hypothetical protein